MTTTTTALADTIHELQTQADAVFTDMFENFEHASTAERLSMVKSFSEYSLQHQAHMASFAHVLENSPSWLSSVAKDLEYRSSADLMQYEFGFAKTSADVLTRRGKLLESREYPVLAAAVEDASISTQQAGVIVRKLDSWRSKCDREFLLIADKAAVEHAEGGEKFLPWKPESLEEAMRSWHKKEYPEQTEITAEQQWKQRSCTARITQDGMMSLNLLTPAAEGAAILSVLEANASPRNVQFRDADDPFDDDTDDRTRPQKMADACMRAFNVYAKTSDTSTQTGAAPTLTVTVPMSEIYKYSAGNPALAQVNRTGEFVPVAEATRIICEGAIQVAMTDNHGNVMNLGRTQRLFTPVQRKAINQTYRTCATTGCDIPAPWTEAHHVTWWSRGGKTDLDNAVNLCNFHHHQVHQGNLDLKRCPDTNRWKAIRAIRR